MNNDICELSFDELDAVTGGGLSSNAQMSMIDLQSFVLQRSEQFELTTNMMSATGSGAKTVAGNIRG